MKVVETQDLASLRENTLSYKMRIRSLIIYIFLNSNCNIYFFIISLYIILCRFISSISFLQHNIKRITNMDFKRMASNIEVDEEDFIELLEMLVEVSTTDLNNFQIDLASGNYSSAARSAHSIKGASGNLGLTDIAGTAAELEKAAKSNDESQMVEKIALLKEELSHISDALSQSR